MLRSSVEPQDRKTIAVDFQANRRIKTAIRLPSCGEIFIAKAVDVVPDGKQGTVDRHEADTGPDRETRRVVAKVRAQRSPSTDLETLADTDADIGPDEKCGTREIVVFDPVEIVASGEEDAVLIATEKSAVVIHALGRPIAGKATDQAP